MMRILFSTFVVVGLVGCAQGQKKADAPADPKAAATKPADTKAAPAEAKAGKATKGKDAKAAPKAEAKSAETSAAPAAAGTVECSSGADKRTITVKAVDKGCEVIYEKNGTTTSPGTGANGLGNCIRIQEKIKTNLVNSGFKCS